MPSTTVTVEEYGGDTKTYSIALGIKVNDSIWDACIEALSPYKSQQVKNHSIARPGHWTRPEHNVGALAATQKWKRQYLGVPHVHAGSKVRATIGCTMTNAVNTNYYATMNLYIGQFGTAE